MLKTGPARASKECKKVWNSLKPITVQLFQQFWAKNDTRHILELFSSCNYQTWTDDNGW